MRRTSAKVTAAVRTWTMSRARGKALRLAINGMVPSGRKSARKRAYVLVIMRLYCQIRLEAATRPLAARVAASLVRDGLTPK